MAAIGVGLLALGVGERDASAQVSGPGVFGIMQGGACIAELSSYAANVSYYAGNGGLADVTASSWVQCPVTNTTGLLPVPLGVDIWIENTGTSTSTCYLHRVSLTNGLITASTSVVAPASMTSFSELSISQPSGSGGFYSLECLLSPGATLLGYYVNMAN